MVPHKMATKIIQSHYFGVIGKPTSIYIIAR